MLSNIKQIIFDNIKTIYILLLVIASYSLSLWPSIINYIKNLESYNILQLEIFIVLSFFISLIIFYSLLKKMANEKILKLISLIESIMIMDTFFISLYSKVSEQNFYFLTIIGYLSIFSLSITSGILTSFIIQIIRQKTFHFNILIKALFTGLYFMSIFVIYYKIVNIKEDFLLKPYKYMLIFCGVIYFLIVFSQIKNKIYNS